VNQNINWEFFLENKCWKIILLEKHFCGKNLGKQFVEILGNIFLEKNVEKCFEKNSFGSKNDFGKTILE
jgi:hypothetical protein